MTTKLSVILSACGLVAALASACSKDDPAAAPSVTPDAAVFPKKTAPPIPDTGTLADCVPWELPGFEDPKWIAPDALGQGRCSDTVVDLMVRCLLSSTVDETVCNDTLYDTANDDCYNCLFTDVEVSKKLGPMIISGGYVTINVGGCVAAKEGNTTGSSCGAKFAAGALCEEQACTPNCSTEGGDAALAAFDSCKEMASKGVCEPFSTPANCADPLLAAGGVAAVCAVDTTDFLNSAVVMGRIFCGGSGADASADAPADAITDAPADGG